MSTGFRLILTGTLPSPVHRDVLLCTPLAMVIIVFGCGGVAVIVALVLHMVLLLIIAIVRAAVCGVIAVASLLSYR